MIIDDWWFLRRIRIIYLTILIYIYFISEKIKGYCDTNTINNIPLSLEVKKKFDPNKV